MIKDNKYYIIPIILLLIILFSFTRSIADEIVNFLSLKNNKVNLRQGPSFDYPIKLTYKKKYLPVFIIDRSETWLQIKDFKNNYGWIHISQLSKRKSAINIYNNSIIYKKPTIYSKPIIKLESGRLVLIEKCKLKWCKIKTGSYVGWINKDSLWGVI